MAAAKTTTVGADGIAGVCKDVGTVKYSLYKRGRVLARE